MSEKEPALILLQRPPLTDLEWAGSLNVKTSGNCPVLPDTSRRQRCSPEVSRGTNILLGQLCLALLSFFSLGFSRGVAQAIAHCHRQRGCADTWNTIWVPWKVNTKHSLVTGEKKRLQKEMEEKYFAGQLTTRHSLDVSQRNTELPNFTHKDKNTKFHSKRLRWYTTHLLMHCSFARVCVCSRSGGRWPACAGSAAGDTGGGSVAQWRGRHESTTPSRLSHAGKVRLGSNQNNDFHANYPRNPRTTPLHQTHWQ